MLNGPGADEARPMLLELSLYEKILSSRHNKCIDKHSHEKRCCRLGMDGHVNGVDCAPFDSPNAMKRLVKKNAGCG